MRELEIFHGVLNDYSSIPVSIDAIKAMESLLTILRAVDSNEFQIAKNAFITLSKIVRATDDKINIELTETEKSEFKKLNAAFNDQAFIQAIGILREQIIQFPSVKQIVIITQHVFSGECLGIASLSEDAAKKNALLFSRKKSLSEAESNNLQSKIAFAETVTKKVGSLCARYRL